MKNLTQPEIKCGAGETFSFAEREQTEQPAACLPSEAYSDIEVETSETGLLPNEPVTPQETMGLQANQDLRMRAARLSALLDADPAEAVRQARQIDVSSPRPLNAMHVRAAILIDGGTASGQQDAIEEGLALCRKLYEMRPNSITSYNLANALVAIVGSPPKARGGPDWLNHQERTKEFRAEARRLYWSAARDNSAPAMIRTQAWTNLANQFSNSYRFGEAHDARLAALDIDPSNGAAAGAAARDLLWLYNQGGCSETTKPKLLCWPM